jgi:hypothetical protein
MDPRHEGDRRIKDERQPDVAAPSSVDKEIPAGDALPVGALDGCKTEFPQPAINRARVGLRGIGTRGPVRFCVGDGYVPRLPRPAAGEAIAASTISSRSFALEGRALGETLGARFSTLPPLRTVRELKSDGRTPSAMRTLRPIRAPAGIVARLPTTVIPVLSRVGSWRFGVV